MKVVAKEYVGGENMLALINQSPPGTFDVALSDAEYVVMLRDGGFIDQMTPADYLRRFLSGVPPVSRSLARREALFGDDPVRHVGLAYRTDMLTAEDVKSYKILWSPKVKGKVGFFDWYLPSMGCISLDAGNLAPVRHFGRGLRQGEGVAAAR